MVILSSFTLDSEKRSIPPFVSLYFISPWLFSVSIGQDKSLFIKTLISDPESELYVWLFLFITFE
jgi:hypothetical protein